MIRDWFYWFGRLTPDQRVSFIDHARSKEQTPDQILAVTIWDTVEAIEAEGQKRETARNVIARTHSTVAPVAKGRIDSEARDW